MKRVKETGSAIGIILAVIAVVVVLGLVVWLWTREQNKSEPEPEPSEPVSMMVENVGFETPESVLYDADTDMYYVSNINGAPLDEDGNGFISQVSPEGTVSELKWINGETEGVTLNAPKGMAIMGDNLYVADINTVRVFNKSTGELTNSIAIDNASFLNDVATDGMNAVYVTDSGLNASFATTGTDAIYKIENDTATEVVADTGLNSPNGIVVDGDTLYVAPFNGTDIYMVNVNDGSFESVATLPRGQLDGLVRLNDGTMYVSSWEAESVYRLDANYDSNVAFDNLPAPADIGYDTTREYVLIPLFNDNAVAIRSQ